MGINRTRGWAAVLAAGMLIILASACSPQGETRLPAPTQPGTYAVDLSFREFYDSLLGPDVLGPAISPVYIQEHYKLQFTANGLMMLDLTAAQDSRRFLLAPLGLQLGVTEDPIEPPAEPDGRFTAGHVIYHEFVPRYDELGGLRVVGRPLTELRYNPEKERLEQYFENLGFYRLNSDPPGTVRTLSYGSFICDHFCRYRPYQASLPTRQGTIPEPFATDVARIGPAFVGRAISKPYTASDGNQEIIFDNLVLYIDPNHPQRVFGRPIVLSLGFQPKELKPQLDDSRMVFHPIEGNLGYNIPKVFTTYLAQHGGLDISGPPISEIERVKDGVWRQCFTNLCLDYHQKAPLGLRVRPAPLGIVYKAEFYTDLAMQDFSATQSQQTITIKVSEMHPILTSQEAQEIHIFVFEAQQPLPSFEPMVTVTLPNGAQRDFHPAPTDRDGRTILILPPIQAPNGTVIAYEVCLRNLREERACLEESYLIWGNP